MNALIFPGQGSQQVGMGIDFADNHALARQLFEEANDTLGFNLQKLCQEGPFEELTDTPNTQVALLTVGYIAHRLLAERVSVRPICVTGHSVGEYTALVAAEALSFTEAVQAVYQRGKFMKGTASTGQGTMAAILGQEDEAVELLCREVVQASGGQEVLVAANYNCPKQVVVSGHIEAVERILQQAKGKPLAVSGAFHSPLMFPAVEKMATVLEKIAWRDAQVPVVANFDNRFLVEAGQFTDSLKNQICSPVRWHSGVCAMIARQAECFIELGSGSVLSGLMKRIDNAKERLQVVDDTSLADTVKLLESR